MSHRLLAAFAIALLAPLAGQTSQEPVKQMPADAGDGRVAWFDLTTTDLVKSKAFYGTLFGWTFAPVKGTDQAIEIVAGGASIGTIRVSPGEISPFNGVVYIQVDDVVVKSSKAKELGATVVPGFPFDLPDNRGSISLIADPAGHPIGMYARKAIKGASEK